MRSNRKRFGSLLLAAALVCLASLSLPACHSFAVPPERSRISSAPTLPSAVTVAAPPFQGAATATELAMATRKKLSEMTEDEKLAEKEAGEKLLVLKGLAFVLAGVAYYVLNN